jgi:hypothetical protein
MPFLPPPALSVDTSQGRDSKKENNPAKKEQLTFKDSNIRSISEFFRALTKQIVQV